MNTLENKNNSSVSERFISALDHVGYTAYRLAKEVDGISQQTITHIRKGRNVPSTKIICAFLEKFSAVNAHWLLTGNGSMLLEEAGEDIPGADSGFNATELAKLLDRLPVDGIITYIQRNEKARGFDESEVYKMFLEIRMQRRMLEKMKDLEDKYKDMLARLEKT